MPPSVIPPNMSKEDLITLIVARKHCDLVAGDLVGVLGYHPNGHDLRYTIAEIKAVYLQQSEGIIPRPGRFPAHLGPSKLYTEWGPALNWELCDSGTERKAQKQKLEARMALVEKRLRESERREVANKTLARWRMKRDQRKRERKALERKNWRVFKAMVRDGMPVKPFKRNAEWFERVVLDGGERVKDGGEGMEGRSRMDWLRDFLLGKGFLRKVLAAGWATKRRVSVCGDDDGGDGGVSKATTLCGRDEDEDGEVVEPVMSTLKKGK